jgi:hypothetical protein
MSRKRKELSELQRFAERAMDSSVRGFTTEGQMTRGNYRSVLPFTVEQRQLPVCAFVTMSKTLIFNLMGMVMDVTLTPHEQAKISALTKHFPIRADTDLVYRYLDAANITPTTCTPKGYALIILFFYFFDWLKKNKMRPSYFPGELVEMSNDDHTSYKPKLDRLFDFLKLKTRRLGGQTFSADGWIQQIIGRVSPELEIIRWKQISVCTLNTPYGKSIPTFHPHDFMRFRDVLFEITTQFKVILTVRGFMGDRFALHDVMIVGIEGNHLLISNSWGEFIDKVPIDELPRIILRVKDRAWVCWAFQFTFLLPFLDEIPFELQYHLGNFGEFLDKMGAYYTQMEALRSLPKLDPGLFDALAESPRAAVGGTRKSNRIRYGRKNVTSSNTRKNASK